MKLRVDSYLTLVNAMAIVSWRFSYQIVDDTSIYSKYLFNLETLNRYLEIKPKKSQIYLTAQYGELRLVYYLVHCCCCCCCTYIVQCTHVPCVRKAVTINLWMPISLLSAVKLFYEKELACVIGVDFLNVSVLVMPYNSP